MITIDLINSQLSECPIIVEIKAYFEHILNVGHNRQALIEHLECISLFNI